MKKRPFSKLKKQIEDLFDPKLKMQFCCISYPTRTQWGNNSIPRFYVKLGKEIIWDYPKDFKIKEIHWGYWAADNDITSIVREYIDTSVSELLKKKFKGEKREYINQYLGTNYQETIIVEYKLTEIFKAADRRLGKERLLDWAKRRHNPAIDKILAKRFGKTCNF